MSKKIGETAMLNALAESMKVVTNTRHPQPLNMKLLQPASIANNISMEEMLARANETAPSPTALAPVHAVTFDGGPVKLDPTIIVPSRWANRHDDSFKNREFEDLKAEIDSAGGNVQSIKVRPIFGTIPQKYEIVFGHRRHRACLELDLPVLADIESLNDQALFVEMDRENRQRADLRPYEQGEMYMRALDAGLFSSLRKMAEALGVDIGNASKAISLARLPEQVIKAFGSPLDLQQTWATPLTQALQAKPDIVFARAKVLFETTPRLSAAEVFKKLIEVEGIVSNNTPVFIAGKSGQGAEIRVNKTAKTMRIDLKNVDSERLNEVHKTIKALIE